MVARYNLHECNPISSLHHFHWCSREILFCSHLIGSCKPWYLHSFSAGNPSTLEWKFSQCQTSLKQGCSASVLRLDYLFRAWSYYLNHLFHLLRCLNCALLHPTVISWAKAAFLSSAQLNPPFNDSFPSVVAFIHSVAFYRPSLAPHPASTASSRFARSNYMTLSTSAGAHAIPTIYGCLSILTEVYNVPEHYFLQKYSYNTNG